MKKLKSCSSIILLFILSIIVFEFFVSRSEYDQKSIVPKLLDKDGQDIDDYRLILVNKNHQVPKAYKPILLELSNGQKVDERIYPDLQDMFDDMRVEGLNPEVSWGYRSNQTQKDIFNDKVETLIKRGFSKKEARQEASMSVAIPGTSEHELGLAVDINEKGVSNTSEEFYRWLERNSYKYGFILRYPYGKSHITGIVYEPWHFRYVGKLYAKEIYNKGLTLEEYLKR